MKHLKDKRKTDAKDAVIFLETSTTPRTGGNLGPCGNSGNGCTGSCNHSSK
jgi:hypothetical protein